MQVVQGRNVNTVWIDGLWRLKTSGIREESRNGPVIVLPEPLTSVYERPWERVLFHPGRDANPFFHLMEALWMLDGGEDIAFVADYNKRMKEFSDDGVTLNGAYGYRWRYHFEKDQLLYVIEMLSRDPTTRRAVLGMWDPLDDLGSSSKDIPCNTHIYFRAHGHLLDMTVCCRSNDAVWGAYGANVVHFSILHEAVARAAGFSQGRMYQISNNFHIYERHWPLLNIPVVLNDYYKGQDITLPLFTREQDLEPFLVDCEQLVKGGDRFFTLFFQWVVAPARDAWELYKDGNIDRALTALSTMPVCDWKIAMEQWLIRRVK